MIEKLDTKMDCVEITLLGKLTECLGFDSAKAIGYKINELVDAVNILQSAKDAMFYAIRDIQNRITALDDPTYHEAEPEPDQYKSTTYMSDGHIKKFYGHDSIVELEAPLPQGTRITIKSITKGGDNE